MIQKKICCISASSSGEEARKLTKEIANLLKISVPILGHLDSVQDYDCIIYLHSNASIGNEDIRRQLKEGSDLNKTFLPVMVNGNWFKNLVLRFKYRGPNLRSPYYELRKKQDYLSFFNNIACLSGIKLQGDTIGAKVSISCDTDCIIDRNGEIIADIKQNSNFNLRLYIGKHSLLIIPKNVNDLVQKVDITVNTIDEEISKDIKFYVPVNFRTDENCCVFQARGSIKFILDSEQEEKFIGGLISGEKKTLNVLAGKSMLRFQKANQPSNSEYKTVNINLKGKNSDIVVNFPKVEVLFVTDKNCQIKENGKILKTLKANKDYFLHLAPGLHKLSFVSLEDTTDIQTKSITVKLSEPQIVYISFGVQNSIKKGQTHAESFYQYKKLEAKLKRRLSPEEKIQITALMDKIRNSIPEGKFRKLEEKYNRY